MGHLFVLSRARVRRECCTGIDYGGVYVFHESGFCLCCYVVYLVCGVL